MELAPIALIVFNRADHVKQTLDALRKNRLANKSRLFVYSDGPRDEEDILGVQQVRELINNIEGFKQVTLVERDSNWGLAKSIITATTELTDEYGKVIVVEDDLVTSPGFLEYMNNALEIYKDDDAVMHISGYMFPVQENLPDTFFYNTTSTWGWGTWKRAWDHYNNNIGDLKQELDNSGRLDEFNIDGTFLFYNQIRANFEGRRKTWGIRWYTSMFLRGGFALHPGKSLVQNIGNDGTGTNAGRQGEYWHDSLVEAVEVKRIPIEKSLVAWNSMKRYYSQVRGNKKGQKRMSKIKAIVKKIVPQKVLRVIKDPNLFLEKREDKRLRTIPRYQSETTELLGEKFKVVDAASYLFQKNELFGRETYKFSSNKSSPYIIDCGANIGVSIAYFKNLYPEAEILAFEPDDTIFEVLSDNMNSLGFQNINLIHKGIWNKETELEFFAEGADGGRVATKSDNKDITKIQVVRLADYLDREVDFLKIDIEGAETVVIKDIAGKLKNVRNLFIEYHSFADQEQTLDEILKVLKDAGFRYHINFIGIKQKHPYTDVKVKLGMDGQINIAAIRKK